MCFCRSKTNSSAAGQVVPRSVGVPLPRVLLQVRPVRAHRAWRDVALLQPHHADTLALEQALTLQHQASHGAGHTGSLSSPRVLPTSLKRRSRADAPP